jgi:hypothetical protein
VLPPSPGALRSLRRMPADTRPAVSIPQLLVDGIIQHKAMHELAARVQQELLDRPASTPGESAGQGREDSCSTVWQELSARLASHSAVMDMLRSAAAINPYLSALLQVTCTMLSRRALCIRCRRVADLGRGSRQLAAPQGSWRGRCFLC